MVPVRRPRRRRRAPGRHRTCRRHRAGRHPIAAHRLRPPAGELRGGRRAPDQGQGPGRLQQRQPLVRRLRDRGHPLHAPRSRDPGVRVRRCRSRSSSCRCSASSSSRTGRPSAPTRTAAAATSSRARTWVPGPAWSRPPRSSTDYVLTVSVSVAAGVAAITSAFPGALDGLRVEISAVAILAVMLDQPARRPRERDDLRDPDVRVRRLDARAHRSRDGPDRARRPAAGDRRDRRGRPGRDARAPAADARLCRRLQRDHGGRGRLERRPRVPVAPKSVNARTTLLVMGVLVGVMFLGTSWLAGVAGAIPSSSETVLSELGRAVFGPGVAYYVLQLSTTGILILAANTAFADFPRLSSLLARDGYMPSRFAFRGERLAFTTGIVALAGALDRGPRRVRRPRGGADPPVRHRRLHLDHAVAGGHGPPLVGVARRRVAAEPGDQRHRRGRDGHRHGGLRRRQVRARGVADRDRDPGAGRRDADDPAALRAAADPDGRSRGGRDRAADAVAAGHRPGRGPHEGRDPGAQVRPDDVRRRHRGPCDDRPGTRRRSCAPVSSDRCLASRS